MPARRDDVAFGYDPRPFLKGLGEVTKGLTNLTKKTTQVAGQITKNLLLIGVAVKGAQALWRQFTKHVPEFGKAFSIAGDIFFKNLFWPLRTMLTPMLQKLLDWTRDHRTMFVRWGQTLANVFRGVINLGRQLVDIFKTITDSLGPAFKRVFGGSFLDFLNVITVKLAVALEFVGRLVKTIFAGLSPFIGPIVDNLAAFAKSVWDLVAGFLRANEEGNSLFTVIKGIAEFAGQAIELVTRLARELVGGFADGLRGAMTPLQGIVDVMKELLGLLVGVDDKTGILSRTFRGLGQLLGETVMINLQALWATLIGIKQGILLTVQAVKGIKAIGNRQEAARVQTETEAMLKAFGAEWGGFGQAFSKYWQGQGQDWADIIGIKDRAPATAQVNPRNLAGMEARRSATIGPMTVYLNVTEGSARTAGENFAAGMSDRVKAELLRAGVAGGD